MASTALPSIFDPIRLTGPDGPETHVDGGIADLVPVAGAPSLAPTRVIVLDASVPARLRRVRTPIDVLLASLAVSMRVRPSVDMPGVEVVHLTAPDLGIRMHDFSRTAEHVAMGHEAATAALRTRLPAAA
jgi:NTE family protein